MRKIILIILGLLIAAPAFPEQIVNNGEGKINFVFLSDGYTEQELSVYRRKVDEAVKVIFETEPFKTHKDSFNVFREDVVSQESGASRPPKNILDTAFRSQYGFGGIDRCLQAVPHRVIPYLERLDYEYDVVVVMVNDAGTGGCTEPKGYSTVSNQKYYIDSILHELGHQIGGLGDEVIRDKDAVYTGPEPDKPNLTINNDITTVKWREFIKPGNGVGIFQGGLYVGSGIYRPMYKSKMADIREEFSPIDLYYLDKAISEMAADKAGKRCNGLKVTIEGTDGNDRIRGTRFDDVIHAGKGDDKIYASFGNDTVCGGEGDDYIHASNGDDYVDGGPGNDKFYVGFGNDYCDGGEGIDRMKFKRRRCETMVNMEHNQ